MVFAALCAEVLIFDSYYYYLDLIYGEASYFYFFSIVVL